MPKGKKKGSKRGAALRASRRARDSADRLQERQAELAATAKVAGTENERLFVIDTKGGGGGGGTTTSGGGGSTTTTRAAATRNRRRKDDDARLEKKRKPTPSGLSAKERAQVDALLKKHQSSPPGTLEGIAERGRRRLATTTGGGRTGTRKHLKKAADFGGGGSRKRCFDLWNNDEDGDGTKKKKQRDNNNDDEATAAAAASTKEAVAAAAAKAAVTTKVAATVRPGIGSTLAGTVPDGHVPVKAKPLSSSMGRSRAAGVAIDVASCGQSFNPDPASHGLALRRAAQVEARRIAAIRSLNEPIGRGMSEETKRYLLGDEDDDSSSEEEGGDEDGGGGDGSIGYDERASTSDPATQSTTTTAAKAATEKLTRAQRNKLKRVRQEKTAAQMNKRRKKLLNQVAEAPRLAKELKRQERERLAAKERERAEEEEATSEKKKNRRVPGKDLELLASERAPIDAPTVPVALPSELRQRRGDGSGGSVSLRCLKPKGSLLTDRMASLIDRGLVAAPILLRRCRSNKRNRGNDDGAAATADNVEGHYDQGQPPAMRTRKKRRRLHVKGKRNSEGVGADFVVLG